MKKILIDITDLSDQYKIRGISRYTRELVKRLVENKEFEWHLLGFDDVKDDLWIRKGVFHRLGTMKLSNPFNPLYFKLKWMPLIKRIQPDLYFAPHFERGLPLSVCKTVVTMHDVTPFMIGKYSSKGVFVNILKGLFYRYNLRRAKQADLIFTHSQFSKSELIKAGFSQQKIKVNYLGVTRGNIKGTVHSFSEILQKYGIQKPYILYFGGIEPNKNIEKLLETFALLIKSERITLVLVDKNLCREKGIFKLLSQDAQRIKRKIDDLGIGNEMVFPGYIEEQDLSTVIHHAEFFTHLSSYEGFGFVALEAMAYGCPVVAADRSCYPEILGDAALLRDPDNTTEIAETMKELLHNKKLREHLIRKGFGRVQKYSWERTTKQTLHYFKELF